MGIQSSKKKNVIITGCNKGIGKATLEEFAKNGANIFACVRSNTQNFKNFEGDKKMNPFPKNLPNSMKIKLAERYEDIFKLFFLAFLAK